MDCLLYGFGTNDSGELGSLRGRWVPHTSPRGVMWFHSDLEDSRTRCASVRTAGCGASFSIIALDANEVVSCGINECCQLGVGATEKETVDELQVIPQLAGQDIQAIACGFDHAVCLTSEGRVWAWGEKSSGQLGIDNNMTGKPQLIRSISEHRVLAISAGASHSLMVLEDGTLISFGSNLKGQLGIGFASEVDDDEGRAQPHKVFPSTTAVTINASR
jgi:alpha-tubulin suppressor-like RCC1 family protein